MQSYDLVDYVVVVSAGVAAVAVAVAIASVNHLVVLWKTMFKPHTIHIVWLGPVQASEFAPSLHVGYFV